MSKMFYGQLNVTEILDAIRAQHTSMKKVFSKKKNAEIIIANITMWENDVPDQFGNTCSIKLNSREDAKAIETQSYIANLKISVPKEKALTANDTNALAQLDNAMSGIPTAQPTPSAPSGTPTTAPAFTPSAEIADDLPF